VIQVQDMALDGAQRSVKVEYNEPGVSFGMIAIRGSTEKEVKRYHGGRARLWS
jgi:hypothetical protein